MGGRLAILYKPNLHDLWFRRELLSDPETMSYNAAWGGIIPFPEDAWADWYGCWLAETEDMRFYRYIADAETGMFVGEVAYHFDEPEGMFLADVIVHALYRGRGYGREGLRLLCNAARQRGVAALYDNIALDNAAVAFFRSEGFVEDYRTDEAIYLRKDL